MQYLYLLLSILIVFVSLCNMLPFPLKKLQYLIIFLYLYIIGIFLIPLGQSSSYFIIGSALILICIFSTHKLLNLCCATIGYLIAVALNHIVLITISSLFGVTTTDTYNRYSISLPSFYLLLIFALTYLLGWFLRCKIKIQDIHFPQRLLPAISVYLLLCAAIFIFNFSYAEKMGYPPEITEFNVLMFSVYFFLSLVILIFTIQTQRKENELQFQIEQRNQLTSYMNTLEHINQNMRAFKHDYVNILSTMRGFIMEDNMDGLRSFFDRQISNTSKTAFVEVGKLSNILILEIKGLLYTKLFDAGAKEIEVNISVPFPLTHTAMDTIDLTRILGIFLDNAIDAAEHTAAKRIDIVILQEDTVSIVIGNTCSVLDIPLSTINEAGVSTKGENRGYGLNNVHMLLQKYPKVKVYTNYKDNYFEQRLEDL